MAGMLHWATSIFPALELCCVYMMQAPGKAGDKYGLQISQTNQSTRQTLSSD